MTFQSGIMKEPPLVARFLTFHLIPDEDPLESVRELAATVDEDTVVGFGPATLARLGKSIEGLREPTAISGAGASIPANPAALWLWLRGSDRGELVHRTHTLADAVEEAFEMTSVAEAFTYDAGRDLSGFKLGTENPKGDAAVETAFVSGQGAGLDGSSFAAVQRWVHDLPRLGSYSPREQDDFIGRTKAGGEKREDARESAHVKRTAQGDFDPPAFLLRRSMPWSDEDQEGLIFVAFGRSFDAFESLLRRMSGAEDGVADALFHFTEPIATSYFWCPPYEDGRLDLRAIEP